MNEFFRILIICLAAIPIGIFLGCGAVYVFNRIPAGWLTDYGETPSPELADQSHQRIPGMPWKYVLSAIFAGLIIYFCTIELGYGASAVLIIWLLLMIGLADAKYMIIPDQFVIFLLLLAGPMSLYKANLRDMLYGALLGGGIMVLIAAIGFILTRRMAIGGGDIKLNLRTLRNFNGPRRRIGACRCLCDFRTCFRQAQKGRRASARSISLYSSDRMALLRSGDILARCPYITNKCVF